MFVVKFLGLFCIFSLIFASSDKVENQVECVDDVFEMD